MGLCDISGNIQLSKITYHKMKPSKFRAFRFIKRTLTHLYFAPAYIILALVFIIEYIFTLRFRIGTAIMNMNAKDVDGLLSIISFVLWGQGIIFSISYHKTANVY